MYRPILSITLSSEKLFRDTVAIVIEKVLLQVGKQAYETVHAVLEAHNMTFRDCYSRPDVLNFALKELYGDSYMVLVNKIKEELHDIQDQKIVKFVELISES